MFVFQHAFSFDRGGEIHELCRKDRTRLETFIRRFCQVNINRTFSSDHSAGVTGNIFAEIFLFFVPASVDAQKQQAKEGGNEE